MAVMLQATFSRAKVAPARCKRSTTAAGAHKNCANDRRQMKNFGVLSRFSSIWLIALILAIGIFLRVWPSTSFRLSGEGKSDHPAQADEEQKKGVWVGRDERAYSAYVALARKDGILNFGDVVRAYLQSQANRPDAIVPATRIGFLVPATIIAEITGCDPLVALRCTSAIASILLLLVSVVIGYRLGGTERMVLVTALMAVAPLQIHLAQLSLVDGYFAFWAVLCAWFLWETLQAPQQKGWLAAYVVSLFLLVLTKENAAFVFLALATVTILFAVFRFGRVSVSLVAATIVAPALAVLVLAALVGGVGEWISFYRTFTQKSAGLPYVVLFQDGAWYRYLVDFTLLSPCIVVLALGSVFQLGEDSKTDVFWAIFLGASYIVMSIVPYGMSLRFAAFWDFPLRWLAVSQVIRLGYRFQKGRPLLLLSALSIALIAIDLLQYWRYFVDGQIYDPVSFQLLRASHLIK